MSVSWGLIPADNSFARNAASATDAPSHQQQPREPHQIEEREASATPNRRGNTRRRNDWRQGTLCTAWIITTSMAVLAIRGRNVIQHREWMLRSYTVTFAFVIFRLVVDMLNRFHGRPAQRP